MSALIRTVGGRETPAPGRWTIAKGRPVTWRAGRRFRRCRATGRTTAGSLLITDPGDLAFHLGFTGGCIPHPTTPHPTTVTYQSISIDPTPGHGLWSVAGELVVNGRLIPARSLLTYHGVFRTGPGAIAWLGWDLRLPTLDLPGRGAECGILRHLELSAQLNAEAPSELTSRGNPVKQTRKAHQS
jgi:hypothetical protein